MSARIRHSHYRNPRTTQERRANQDSEYVRGKRSSKNLPNAYDDIPIPYKFKVSWKKTRKTQYREETKDFSWHFYYEIHDAYRASRFKNIINRILKNGYYYEWVKEDPNQYGLRAKYGIKWFGKDIS
jgi:hypothetical protein